MAKLREYRQAEPGVFWRYLLSAAVLWGSRRLLVKTGLSQWRIRLEGTAVSFDELCNLIPSLSMSSRDRRGQALRQLALAVTQLMAAGDVKVQLTAGAAQLRLSPRDLRVSPSRGAGSPEVLELETSGLSWWERLKTPGLAVEQWVPRFLETPKLEAFRKAARYAPLELHLNGQPQGQGPDWECLANARLNGRSPLPPVWERWTLDHQHAQEVSLMVGLYPRKAEPAVYLSRGLLFEQTLSWPLACRVLVSHDGLTSDLLGAKLVEDPTYFEARQSAEELLIELAESTLLAGNGKLQVDLAIAWHDGLLTECWLRLPFLQLGGWPGPSSPAQLKELYVEQGYLALDPSVTAAGTVQALQKHFPNLILLTPSVPLEAVDNPRDWLLRVPTPVGEVRYRDQWPMPPARAWVRGREVDATGLANGLELHLWRSPEAGLADLCDVLVNPLVTRLSTALLGSAAALQLALWLADRPRGSRLQAAFRLRLHGGGVLPLYSVLGSHVYYLPEGSTAQNLDRSRQPVLTLSEGELSLLEKVATVEALSAWSLDLGRLGRATSREELSQWLLEMCQGVLGASRACFFVWSGGRLELLCQRGQEGVALDGLMDSKLPLLSALSAQMKDGPALRTAISHPPQATAVDVQKLRLYASAVVGDQALLYFERKMKVGPFTDSEQELLRSVATQLEPLLQNAGGSRGRRQPP